MANQFFGATSLTGGGDGALDTINGSALSDDDKAFVSTAGAFYTYNLEVDDGGSESSPTKIAPDDNAGDKIWELAGVAYNGNAATFTSADLTPSVLGYNVFLTGGADTYTDFDDGHAGQRITVISKHAAVFDVTTAQDATHNLDGSSANITTASGDVTEWICEDGTTWHLIRFNDASSDHSNDA